MIFKKIFIAITAANKQQLGCEELENVQSTTKQQAK